MDMKMNIKMQEQGGPLALSIKMLCESSFIFTAQITVKRGTNGRECSIKMGPKKWCSENARARGPPCSFNKNAL